MSITTDLDENAREVPTESQILKHLWKKSGMTLADLAASTGLSVGTLSIAFSGIRYREGQARVAVPPDRTIVRLSSALHIEPATWRAIGRGRAADLLEEVINQAEAAPLPVDAEAVAALAGRAALARKVLAAFSSAELQSELGRRETA